MSHNIKSYHITEFHQIRDMLNTQNRSRLVGPNSPGIISAIGKCRIGFQPLPCFKPGIVGIVARSGTLSYETVTSTTRAGVGQSLVVGMGGDILPGTDFVDALTLFEHHEDTKGIILVGEIGGEAELRAADWIREYRKRTKHPKYCQLFVIARDISDNDRPIMALIAGFQAPFETVMGHAGAFARSESEHGNEKVKALIQEGVIITNHPSKFGIMMKQMLDDLDPVKWRGLAEADYLKKEPTRAVGGRVNQARNIHTATRRPRLSSPRTQEFFKRNGHFLSSDRSLQLLEAHQVPIVPDQTLDDGNDIIVRIGIDRPSGQLCAAITSPKDVEDKHHVEIPRTRTLVPLNELGRSGPQDENVEIQRRAPAFFYLQSHFPRKYGAASFSSDPTGYLPKLMQIFINEETFSLYARFRRVDHPGGFSYEVVEAQVGLDALVYQGPKISPEVIEKQRIKLPQLSQEEIAAKDGIVYVKSVLYTHFSRTC